MAKRGDRAISTAATSTILISNARTPITEWCFEPSAATGFHRHKHDYVVSPRTSGKLKLIDGENYATFGELTEGPPISAKPALSRTTLTPTITRWSSLSSSLNKIA